MASVPRRDDGREVDLTSFLWGPVFAPLKDVEFFRRFTVHPEFQTLVRPNGADLAPEYLHERARVAAQDAR
jgi:hypothetical protein